MIDLSHISKDFGDGEAQVHAVRDVSLKIADGDIFGVIGFSGAGKSTLVRCINLLERPTKGSVIVDGLDMTSLSAAELREARKSISMIFQHFNLLSSATVYDNVAFPLRISGMDEDGHFVRVPQEGETVHLQFHGNAVHLFRKEDGVNLEYCRQKEAFPGNVVTGEIQTQKAEPEPRPDQDSLEEILAEAKASAASEQ